LQVLGIRHLKHSSMQTSAWVYSITRIHLHNKLCYPINLLQHFKFNLHNTVSRKSLASYTHMKCVPCTAIIHLCMSFMFLYCTLVYISM
jgi:hypothetical protein